MADIADLRAVIEQVAGAEDAQMRQLDEGRRAVTELRAVVERMNTAASDDEEVNRLRPRVDRLKASTERFISEERMEQVEQEGDAALARLMTRLPGDDAIVVAHSEVMAAARNVIKVAREGDDHAFKAARKVWSARYGAFMAEAQKRLGSRLPERGSTKRRQLRNLFHRSEKKQKH